MLRWILILVAVALLLGVGFYGAIFAASESGEVIVVTTYGDDDDGGEGGDTQATRLWVVDCAGGLWTRAGHADKSWYRRLVAHPRVTVKRRKWAVDYIAVPVTDLESAKAVNRCYKDKYGMADWIVGLSGDPARRVPIRLDPVE
jgi:hypothetical protein